MLARLEGEGGACEFGAGVFQIGRLVRAGASLALVSPRLFKAALGTGPYDVSIGKKALFRFGIEVIFGPRLDQPFAVEVVEKFLRRLYVARPSRPAVVVEGK